jgi:hypothetical protein
MSDWKNPNFRDNDWQRWSVPEMNNSTKEKPDITLVVRGILGFIFIISINTVALFTFLNVLGFSVSYRNSTIASLVFVMWRVYDITVFKKIRSKE